MVWLHDNANRVILAVGGAVLLVAAALLRKQQALASTLAVLGLAAFVIGVLLPRLMSFSVGPKGLDAKMDRIEKKVDEVVRFAETRRRLAELIAQGDQVASALTVNRDMVLERIERLLASPGSSIPRDGPSGDPRAGTSD